MNFTAKIGHLEKQAADCLVVGVFEEVKLTETAAKLDKISGHYISNLLKKQEDFQGKLGQVQMLYHVPNIASSRILLVGCGKQSPLTERNFRKIMVHSTKTAANTAHIVNFLTEIEVNKHPLPWKIKHAVEATRDALYVFDQFKSVKDKKHSLKEVIFAVPNERQLAAVNDAIKQGIAIADGVDFTKNLGNLPSNICTPTYLAEQAELLAKNYKAIAIDVLDKKAIKKLGMGALTAVAQGSDQDAKLVCITYKGTPKKQNPVVFVGKGITFDTGGINLKPLESMIGMKYDMSGAGTVLGIIKTIAELKLPINVVGILACAENMPGGGAVKTEDIVRTLSGQTVEIISTDAEGRLVLCDALTYAERFNPEVVIDIATLTASVVIGLGHHASALLSNHEPLVKDLLEAGIESHDRAWQMPLWEEYQDQLKSPFADMSNVGGKPAGVITAACFLSRFTKKFKWAHLDVAGTAAWMGGSGDRAATGRPVPMLVQYLINRCNNFT